MTCIEKLREIHPDYVSIPNLDIPRGCPHDYYISPMVKGCEKVFSCKTCWNREIPEERFNRYTLEDKLTGESMRRLDNLCDRLDKDPEKVVEAALLLYEDALNAVDEGSQRWMTLNFVCAEENT